MSNPSLVSVAYNVVGQYSQFGKLVVGAIALMVALSALGYPVTSVIAGLGIGGVALALAAQKTVENLFGSVSILADQPFQVGDTIRVDTVEGTVETIGLRSTRMRTVDRTLIIIPNGKLADMRIESLGPRDRMRFATRLSLVLLQRSGELAQEERTPFIVASHVKKAHAEISEQNKLTNTMREQKIPGEDMKKRLAPLTKALIDGKVKALLTYKKSTGSLLGDMNRLAKVPLAEDGLDAFRKNLQSFVHFVAECF